MTRFAPYALTGLAGAALAAAVALAAPERAEPALWTGLGLVAFGALIEARARGLFRRNRAAAFFAALGLAPAAMAAAAALLLLAKAEAVGGFLLLAAIFGLPSYLLVGGPCFWRQFRRGQDDPGSMLLAGFVANASAAPFTGLIAILLGGDLQAALGAALFVHGFGLLFSPLFGFLFGLALLWLRGPTPLRSHKRSQRPCPAT